MNEINEIFLKQIKKQDELLTEMMSGFKSYVKIANKTMRFQFIALLIFTGVVLISFFVAYFSSDSSKEIRERNSNYNYNENINKNDGGVE